MTTKANFVVHCALVGLYHLKFNSPEILLTGGKLYTLWDVNIDRLLCYCSFQTRHSKVEQISCSLHRNKKIDRDGKKSNSMNLPSPYAIKSWANIINNHYNSGNYLLKHRVESIQMLGFSPFTCLQEQPK